MALQTEVRLAKHAFPDILPYGHMVTPTVVLLHDPMGPRPVPINFSLGCMWRVEQPNVDAISENNLTTLAKALVPPIAEMPYNAVFEARTDFEPADDLQEWAAYPPRQNATAPMIDAFRAHIKRGMPHRINKQPARLLRATCHIGFRMPVNLALSATNLGTLVQLLSGRYDRSVSNLEKMIEQQAWSEYENFRDMARVIEDQYRRHGFEPRLLDAQGLTELISKSLNPIQDPPLYDPEIPLRGSVGSSSPTLAIDAYRSAGMEAHIYSLRKAVGRVYPGMLSAVRKPDDLTIGADLWQLAQHHRITVVTQITMLNQLRLKKRIGSKQRLGKMFGLGYGGETRSDVEIRVNHFDEFARELNTNSKKGVGCAMHIIAWGKEGSFESKDRLLQFALKRLGMEIFREDTIANTIFTRTLPLGNDPRFPAESDIDRMRTMPDDRAVYYLPVYGSFKGFGKRTPGVPVLNKRGEPVYFSILHDCQRPHFVVTGATRAGKSFYVNWLAHNLLPLGTTFIFVDRYGSYKTLCEIHGGRHYDFTYPLCFGPFDGPLDDVHQEYLINTMIEMCTSTQSHIVNTLEHDEVLVLSELLSLWAKTRKFGPVVPTLGEFAEYMGTYPLPKYQDLCDKFILRLKPFYGDGRYAGFIDGKCEIRIDRGLWSFDLSRLDDAPQLAAVITTILFRMVDLFARNPANLDHPKMFVIDEASFELKSPHSVELIRRSLVAYTRFWLSVGIISQQPTDFGSGEGSLGRILRNICGSFWTFSIGTDEAQSFVDIFQLPQHCVKVIKSLGREDGAGCSEGFVYLQGQDGTSSGMGGEFVVVGDPEFAEIIGQDRSHRHAREAREKELASMGESL